jgi:hypothetical protein
VVLVFISYHEGHLGLRGTNVAIETTHGNQLAFYFDHKSQSVHVVDGGEPLNFNRTRRSASSGRIGRRLQRVLSDNTTLRSSSLG